MTDSTHLKLPFILPGQAQKHITHNEAIAALDTLTQLAVLDRNLGAPPVSPPTGARYIIGDIPTGLWAGKSTQIAAWDGTAWLFHAPEPGWLSFVLDENGLLVWSGTAWLPTLGLDAQAPMLGLNATPDPTNRLAVASDAVLFTHATDDMRLKINKHSFTNTASLLFQTGFSGRAEFGTTGDDKLHLKVSPDGTGWTEALVVDPATGVSGFGGPVGLLSHLKSALPPASVAGALIFVSDEVGGAVVAFADGTDWRRVTDRAVVS